MNMNLKTVLVDHTEGYKKWKQAGEILKHTHAVSKYAEIASLKARKGAIENELKYLRAQYTKEETEEAKQSIVTKAQALKDELKAVEDSIRLKDIEDTLL